MVVKRNKQWNKEKKKKEDSIKSQFSKKQSQDSEGQKWYPEAPFVNINSGICNRGGARKHLSFPS